MCTPKGLQYLDDLYANGWFVERVGRQRNTEKIEDILFCVSTRYQEGSAKWTFPILKINNTVTFASTFKDWFSGLMSGITFN